MQEIDRRAEAYVITSTARECNWNTTLLSCLQNIANKQNQSYVFVASVSLVGIYGSFFARKECVDRIKDVQRCRVGCGLMGFMANKGGVGLRVRIDDEYIVLVSSHLAAHTQNVSKRNYEYADLCKRMHFTREDCFMPKISLEEINHPNIKNFNSKSTKELADSSTNHSTSQSDMKETSSSSSGETNTNNVIKINADDSVFAFDLTNSHIDNENFDQKKSSNPILKIINQWIDRPSMAAGLAAFEENELKCVRTIFDGGFLFWAGDLNYRLDLDLEETKLLARERRYEELFRYDQLCVQQAAGLAFSIFLEGDSDYQRLTHQYIDAAYQAALAADAELFESLIIHSDPKTVSQKIDESSSESPTFSTEINVYLGKNNIEDSKSANSDLEHISNLMETVNVHSRHEKTTGSSLGNSESTEIQCKNDADLNVLNCEPHADFNSRFEKSNHNVNNLVSSNEASTSQFNDSSQESVNRFNHHINSKALTNSTLNSIKHNIYSKIDAPSFKYIPGTIHFDEGPKGRAPAWADRILHRKGDRTTCVRNPKTILEVLSSDHKPVCAQYQIEVAKINHDIFRSLIEGCMTNMDTFENDAIPKMVVSDNLVDLGCLVWGRPACQVIQITNVGNVFTKFSFGDSTDDESNTVPNWIFINPNSGILPPATSIKISINALLGPGTFDQFKHFRKPQYPNETEVNKNSNSLDNLSHILVMHVSGGSDHFISVDYSIRRSSPFGKSLIELSELEGLTAVSYKFHRHY